jgi:hypothetical protein
MVLTGEKADTFQSRALLFPGRRAVLSESKKVDKITKLAQSLSVESLKRVIRVLDAESRTTWTELLIKRGHASAELASKAGFELAQMVVG